jgi:ribose 5-phosphate isomerase B
MKKLITELDVVKFRQKGISVIVLTGDEIITPAAKDKFKEYGITIASKDEAAKIDIKSSKVANNTNNGKVVIGSDHTGFKLKNFLTKILSDKGFEIIDVGTFDEKSCDYPDFALAVASKVKSGEVEFGVIIDATGNPSAITANKLHGIRAANCYNEFSARSAREHNNANVLSLGAKALGEETVRSIIETWLSTNFGGGRHQRRIDKISQIEENVAKNIKQP